MKTYNISERSLLNFLEYSYKMGKTADFNCLIAISKDDNFRVVKNEVLKMVQDNASYFKALEEDLKPKFHEN